MRARRRFADAIAAAAQPGTMVIAGGTELLNWMKEGIVAPRRLVDLNGLSGLDRIETGDHGLRIGALARMSDVAGARGGRRDYPVIVAGAAESASAQIRNMASMGGNLMQRTRCPYFRAEIELALQQAPSGQRLLGARGRRPLRRHLRLERALHRDPSVRSSPWRSWRSTPSSTSKAGRRARTIPLADLYRLPGDAPERETVLEAGELITAIEVPASAAGAAVALSEAARARILRVRARLGGGRRSTSTAADIREARIALGGVARQALAPVLHAEQALAAASPLSDAAGFAARPGRRLRRRPAATPQWVQDRTRQARGHPRAADRGGMA